MMLELQRLTWRLTGENKMKSTLADRLSIEDQLIKAVPMPVGDDANGKISIVIKSALGKTKAITIRPDQFKAIEYILLDK